MPTNNDTGYFKAGISVHENLDKAYYQNQDDMEDDDYGEEDSDNAPEDNPDDTLKHIATMLNKVLKRLPAYEPMMQSAQETPQEVDASPKRFQDYLHEFLVTDSTWKAPKRERIRIATHVVQQALPEALIADTTNQHVSPFVREFMLRDHTSLAAVQTPDPKTTTIHNPSTKGIATPLERQERQGHQWFDPQAMQTQAPQALEQFRNPPHHRLIANAETVAQQYDVEPQYTVAYNPPAPTPFKAKEPTYKGSISVTEVIKATGLGNYPAVLNGVFGYRGNVLTSQQLAERIQKSIYEEKRTLQIAKELNNILVQNEQKGAYRDDAWATAQGIQCIASYNTYNGKLNLDNFRRDLAKFFIDQPYETAKAVPSWAIGYASKTLHGVTESPIASQTFGAGRIRSYGWHSKYVEFNNRDANQAHHLAAFIIAGIDKGKSLADVEAYALDSELPFGIRKENPADIRLGDAGATIGHAIRIGRIPPSQIGKTTYNIIKEK